jgi:hypothetical protein
MAATTYYAKAKLTTLALRRRGVEGLINLLGHMEALNAWLTALTVGGDGTVTITLTNPLSAAQLDHLDLQETPP